MKQEMVIKLSWMTNQKSRNKALQITAGFRGVESVAIAGNDMNRVDVIGDGVDPVKLMILLRKRGYAELVSVNAGDDNNEVPEMEPQALPLQYGGWSPPHCNPGVVFDLCFFYDPCPSSCSFL